MSNCPTTNVPTQFCTCVQCQKPAEPVAASQNVEHVAFDEALCLEYDPFADDFGDPGDRILRDKVCTARKPGACHTCAQQIVPGTRTRSLSAKFDGELRSYRWCVHCCAAMAEVHKDRPEGDETEPFAAIEARYALRGRA